MNGIFSDIPLFLWSKKKEEHMINGIKIHSREFL